MKTKAFVFDFFGVITAGITELWIEKHFFKGKMAKKIKDEIFSKSDTGSISYGQFLKNLADTTKVTPKEAEKELLSYCNLNLELLAFILELRKNHKTAICSNASSMLLKTFFPEKYMKNYFDEIVISSDIGHVKPYPEIYKITLDKLGVLPEEAVLIDDLERNIEGAKAIGMKGVIFKSNEQLFKELPFSIS